MTRFQNTAASLACNAAGHSAKHAIGQTDVGSAANSFDFENENQSEISSQFYLDVSIPIKAVRSN